MNNLMRNSKFFSLALLAAAIIGLLVSSPVLADDSSPEPGVNVYFFWGDGCQYCAKEKIFLQYLADKYPQIEIRDYELYYSKANQAIFQRFAEYLDFQPQAVPVTIIGDKKWIGFRDDYEAEIENAVQTCLDQSCKVDVGLELGVVETQATEPAAPAADPAQGDASSLINLPILGQVDLAAQSLAVSTAIIGFVDGFNPCSLWVLSVLLAITLHSGSRTKIIVVGLTFLIVTTIVYSLFIAGVFTLFSYVGYLRWIQVLVALIAFVFAAVNIKDYFWYKEGVSFTIADKHKPKIYHNMRSAVVTPRSILGLIGSTAVLAVGVSLIEFACTAGFPVIWSNLMIANNVGTWTFILLLGLYMLIYLLDELAIFGAAVVTMKASKVEEKHGRVLKLVSGMVILALGLVMLIDPNLMNQINTSLLVFAFALALSWAVYIIHRRILPRFGVYIGSGFHHPKGKKKKRH